LEWHLLLQELFYLSGKNSKGSRKEHEDKEVYVSRAGELRDEYDKKLSLCKLDESDIINILIIWGVFVAFM